jgi:hypothetical protein
VNAEETERVLSRAVEMAPLAWEAWATRGALWLAGLHAAHRRRRISGIDAPLRGAPELGDVEVGDIAEGRRMLELAAAAYVPPLHAGYACLEALALAADEEGGSGAESKEAERGGRAGGGGGGAAAARIATLPGDLPVPDASPPAAPLAGGGRAALAGAPRADVIFSSASGVGGGLLGSDE